MATNDDCAEILPFRQCQITSQTIGVNLITNDKKETMSYLTKRAMQILRELSK